MYKTEFGFLFSYCIHLFIEKFIYLYRNEIQQVTPKKGSTKKTYMSTKVGTKVVIREIYYISDEKTEIKQMQKGVTNRKLSRICF